MQENRSTQTECSTRRCVKLDQPFLSRWSHLLHQISMQKTYLTLKNCFLPGSVELLYFIQPSISVSFPLGCFSIEWIQQFTFATSYKLNSTPNHDAFTAQSPTSGEKICKIFGFSRTVHCEWHSSVWLWIIHSL